MLNVLLAGDEPLMLQRLSSYFMKDGFNVLTALDGEQALELFYEHQIDIAVLDGMLPKVSGAEVGKEIKKASQTKVLLMTAEGETEDKPEELEDELYALQAGADQYIRKPVDPNLLLVRVRKLLNWACQLQAGHVLVDLEAQKVYRDGLDVRATPQEFQLMKYLAQNKGQIVTRKMLLDHYFGDERTVDTDIRRLTEKIGENRIKTYPGLGYCLEDSTDE